MVRYTTKGVTLYAFEALARQPGLRHAVSTRLGGVSPPPFDSLNLTTARGDSPDHVAENRRRLCAALEISPTALVSPQQVHGARIARVGRGQRGQWIPECDGLITDEPETALLLRFADCVPLIVYDPEHGAVGIGHAGWRGTVAGIAESLVRAMRVAFGSRPEALIAGVGPAIGPCCYQVGSDVVQQVVSAFGEADGLLIAQSDGSYHLNLWEANRRQLARAGVQQIEVAALCTACHTEEFYSHRAEHGRTGHHGALVYLHR